VNPVLTVSSKPEPEVEKVVGEGLNAFNDAVVGYADRVPLHVVFGILIAVQLLAELAARHPSD
jgi:hypothetical protein